MQPTDKFIFWLGNAAGERAVVIEDNMEAAIHRVKFMTMSKNFDDLSGVWVRTLAKVRSSMTRNLLCFEGTKGV